LGWTLDYLLTGRQAPAPSDGEAARPLLPVPDGSRVIAWETIEDLPDASAYVTVPHYDVRLSAGSGASAEWVNHAENEPLVFRLRWFQARNVRPSDCRALYVTGASMEPTLLDRDTVLIDTTSTAVQDDTIFAVLYHGDLYIKRLFRLPDGVELRSDNPRHPSPQVRGADLDALTILGRMIWRAG
jgi:phage repressor protein C with HTH and peptisase S24 domain